MKIFLCDHTHPSRDKVNWHRALTKVFGRLFEADETEDWDNPEKRHSAYRDRNAVIVSHSRSATKWAKKADRVLCHIILVHTRDGQRPEANKKGNLHGCYWSPEHFLKVPRPARLQAWIEQIRKAELEAVDWSLLQPGHDTPATNLSQLIAARTRSLKKLVTLTATQTDDDRWLQAVRTVQQVFADDQFALHGFFNTGSHHESGSALWNLLNKALTENVTPEVRKECLQLLRAELKPEYARTI